MERNFFLREAERQARQYIWNFYRGKDGFAEQPGPASGRPRSCIGLREATYFRDLENARAFFAAGGAANVVPMMEISAESYEAEAITDEVCVVLCEYGLRPRGIAGPARRQSCSMLFKQLADGSLALCHLHISGPWVPPAESTTQLALVRDGQAAGEGRPARSLAPGRHGLAQALEGSEEIRRLTPQQKRVLQLLLAGKTYKEAGAILGITHRTVRFHMTKLFEKFGVECREELFAALLDRVASAGEEQPLAKASG